MFRYAAFVWDDEDADARNAAYALCERLRWHSLQWVTALQRPGIALFYAEPRVGSLQTYSLPNDGGVVLGTLFVRAPRHEKITPLEEEHAAASCHAPLRFDASQAERLIRSEGRLLTQDYWGRYVAFLHDAQARETWVLRDPTAALPCLTLRHRKVEVFFSSMDTADSLQLGPFSIDWEYIAAWPCYQKLEVRGTGFKEISQLLGGECAAMRAGCVSKTFYWDPLQVANTEPIAELEHAVAALKSSTRNAVHTWASCFGSIIHTLSGGLDSSIVLACLKNNPAHTRFICVNYHSPGSNTDERNYARLAAQRAECELLERERDPALSLQPLLRLRRSAAPSNYRYYLENTCGETELARARGAEALFSGEIGDQLFYQGPGRFAAGDYLHRRGWLGGVGPGLFSVALDAARLDRSSVWSVLGDAFLHALGKRWSVAAEVGRFQTLMPEDVVREARSDRRFVHPWFQRTGIAPSGKIWQAFLLSLPPFEFYDPLASADSPERIAPLQSQPLIELCLRIPTDLLTAGGWDRAVARRAFQHDLPREIVVRRNKGGVEEYSRLILFRNVRLVRELLLEGELAAHGLLDRARVEEVLSGRPTRGATTNVELYDFLSLEAWLRSAR